MRNLRRTRELALRNSAKYIRNFGRSMTQSGKKERVAQSRPRRLFIKNTAICESVMRRIGGDTCPVPEG